MGRGARFHNLAGTVFLLIAAIVDSRSGQWHNAAERARQVYAILADPAVERACSHQLEQLRREQELPQLTLQQVRYLACQLAVTVGSKVLAAHYCPHLALLLDDTQWPALTAAQVAQFTAAGISCTEVMIQLEPQNPKSVFVAASGGIWSPIEAQQAVDMHLSLCSLAQHQCTAHLHACLGVLDVHCLTPLLGTCDEQSRRQCERQRARAAAGGGGGRRRYGPGALAPSTCRLATLV